MENNSIVEDLYLEAEKRLKQMEQKDYDFVAAGGVMALAMFVCTGTYESNPTKILATLFGSGFALLSLLLVAFANVGTQGTSSYVNCMIVKSGMPKETKMI